MSRERLPMTRRSLTHRAVIHGEDGRTKFFFTIGLYEDGRPGEIFLHMDQSGCTIDGFADCWAIAVSMCLQNGVSFENLYQKFAFQDFEPRGLTDDKKLHTAKSVVDYVMQWMKQNCEKETK